MWGHKLPECQKLEEEKLFRGWSPGFDLLSSKGVALSRLILAQEQGESGVPIKISPEGLSVFRFFLNPRGFGTGRNEAPPVQQRPPCSLWPCAFGDSWAERNRAISPLWPPLLQLPPLELYLTLEVGVWVYCLLT